MANILLVDDDEQLLQKMLQDFRAAGHVCRAETSGESALGQIEHAPVDLVILDVMLPGISGFELCRRIRANEQYYSLPILLLSAMNNEEEVSHGLAQGADDYITKPFRFDALLRRVELLLSQQAQIPVTDPATELLTAKAVKLEIQRAVNTRQPFELAYVELLNITDFGRVVGEEQRLKAMRHLARGIGSLGEKLKSPVFRAGHLGGGHFLCILPKGVGEEFCRAASRMWRGHLLELYESIGKGAALALAQPANAASSRKDSVPILDTSYFVTGYEGLSAISFRELFETISRLRESSKGRGAGIYIDRRG